MARIRTVKPELMRHEGLFDAEIECGLPLRLAYIGLFMICDRKGRFKWRPRSIKSEVFPYDDIDFSRVLDALATRGFIVKYASSTDVFGCIPTFNKHQQINNREASSILPDYTDEDCQVIVFNEDFIENSHVTHASATRGSRDTRGREGKGIGREEEGNDIARVDDAKKNTIPALSENKNLTKNQILKPDDVELDVWSDFNTLRKAKKAPITGTVLRGIRVQAEEAKISFNEALQICCQNGWQSFQASWYENLKAKNLRQAGNQRQPETIPEFRARIEAQVERIKQSDFSWD